MSGVALSIVAPKGRKYLSADALFGLVCRSFANILDDRGDAVEIALTDALMSAFALDGTGYFASTTIHCASCLHKVHRHGSTTYAHQMLGAALIHPDVRAVILLMPEPIVK